MKKTKNIALAGILTALLAVFSQIAIPFPVGVPLTLQTFAVAITGFMLPPLWSFLSVFTYLFIGIAGIPVFSNFKAGFEAILGPTGGFLIGFIFLALGCSVQRNKKPYIALAFSAAGLIICHISGIWWFSFASGNGFFSAAVLVSLPYLLKDVLSVVGAYYLARKVQTRLGGTKRIK